MVLYCSNAAVSPNIVDILHKNSVERLTLQELLVFRQVVFPTCLAPLRIKGFLRDESFHALSSCIICLSNITLTYKKQLVCHIIRAILCKFCYIFRAISLITNYELLICNLSDKLHFLLQKRSAVLAENIVKP